MLKDWQKNITPFLRGLRSTALWTLLVGVAQVLLSLLVWQLVFADYPLGFSMALTLVGFGSWFFSFFATFSTGRRGFGPLTNAPEDVDQASGIVGRVQDDLGRTGCATVLFTGSLVPLAIAFWLRVQADLSSGKTWSDIFPPMQ